MDKEDVANRYDCKSIPILLTATDVEEWVSESGDHNPIHLDPRFAKSYGFERNFAHGLLCVLVFQDRLSEWIKIIAPSDQLYLDYRFRKPVYIDDVNHIILNQKIPTSIQSEIRNISSDEVSIYMTARNELPSKYSASPEDVVWRKAKLTDRKLHLGRELLSSLTPLNRLQVLASKAYFEFCDPFSETVEQSIGVNFQNKEVLHLRHQVSICSRRAFELAEVEKLGVDVAVWWDNPISTEGYKYVTANILTRYELTDLVAYKMSFRVSDNDAG